MYKKARYTCKVVVLLMKPTVFYVLVAVDVVPYYYKYISLSTLLTFSRAEDKEKPGGDMSLFLVCTE